MCSTISIPIFPKIPKIILRKLPYEFGHFVHGNSAKNWEMLQLLRLIQWRLHILDREIFFKKCAVLVFANKKHIN